MRNLGKGDQICDGVVDCPDFSDELYCPYCPFCPQHFPPVLFLKRIMRYRFIFCSFFSDGAGW